MKRKSRSLDNRLSTARQAIANAAANTEIKQALLEYNYDENRIKEGQELLEKAEKLFKERYVLDADKDEAAETYKRVRQEAGKIYSKHRKIARLALMSQPAAVQALGLKGVSSRTKSGWLEEARQFYTNALSEAGTAASLEDFGIGREKLLAGREMLEKVEQADADLEKKKGKALQVIQERDRALKDLDRWLSTFLKVCRIALSGGKAQLLEALGIVVPR